MKQRKTKTFNIDGRNKKGGVNNPPKTPKPKITPPPQKPRKD